MVKRLFALTMTAAMVLSTIAFAETDTTTSASYQATTETPTVTKPATSTSTTVTVAPVVEGPKTYGSRLLALKAIGEDVEQLQVYLNTQSFQLVVDGVFGSQTKAALISFQKANGLSADGKFGAKSLAKLNAAVDAITTASLVNDEDAFEAAIGAEGTWIITTLKDLEFDTPLVLDGLFYNGKTDAEGNPTIARKIGLYTQDEERNVTASFELTAPSLTINSPNARLQNGTFNGDLYVSAENFNLRGATVNGDVYFTTQAAKDTFTQTDAKISGSMILIEMDAATSASLTYDAATFEKSLSNNGPWIIAQLQDLTYDHPLKLTGYLYNGKVDAAGKPVVQRKIASYSQDESRNITRKFTLTAPSITIESPNARIQGGIFVGDVYVSADNFQLVKQAVVGNVYFTTQSAKDTFKMDADSSVSGVKELVELDAVTTASITYSNDVFEKALGTDGTWLIASLKDMTFDMPLTLEGSFLNGKLDADGNPVIQRKIAIYSQDDAHNITRKFTLTAPSITITSPNARIQGGIFVGDLYVNVDNFQLVKQEVQGNIYFGSQSAKDTFKMDAASSVSGVQEVK